MEVTLRLPAVPLGRGAVSDRLSRAGVRLLSEAGQLIEALPYGRTSSRGDPLSVLKERRGTCTLKHALLKMATDEAALPAVSLMLGIYELSEQTNPGAGRVLAQFGLQSIPEAHCYLMHLGSRLDFTGLAHGRVSPFERLISEQAMSVSDLLAQKEGRHKAAIASWASSRNLDSHLLWTVREAVIGALNDNVHRG